MGGWGHTQKHMFMVLYMYREVCLCLSHTPKFITHTHTHLHQKRRNRVGVAYGLTTAIQNGGLALFPLVAAAVYKVRVV